jgi:hypothetical protein
MCPKEIMKIFLIEDFFHLPPVFSICHRCKRYQRCTLSCEYLREFFENIWNGPNGITRGLGETDSWKNQKEKISWHWTFKKGPRGKKRGKTWSPHSLKDFLLRAPARVHTWVEGERGSAWPNQTFPPLPAFNQPQSTNQSAIIIQPDKAGALFFFPESITQNIYY